MERKYSWITALFGVLALVSLSGFLQTYLVHFPTFESIPPGVHMHFVLFLLWIAMILYQPTLIKKRKLARHKSIGKLSYLLVPLMLVTIWMMIFHVIQKYGNVDEEKVMISTTGSLLDSLSFTICYLISMRNKSKTPVHVAFLIGACLIVFNPGIGRLIAQSVSNDLAILVMILLPILIPLGILLYEKIRLGRKALKSPYLLFMLIWVIEVLAFILLPQQTFWRDFVKSLT
jgi:hypothetical protein